MFLKKSRTINFRKHLSSYSELKNKTTFGPQLEKKIQRLRCAKKFSTHQGMINRMVRALNEQSQQNKMVKEVAGTDKKKMFNAWVHLERQ